MSRPLISIILPTYNRSKQLDHTIENVLTQSFKDIELLIINDCSTDNTKEIIKSWMQKDKRIKFLYNTINMGTSTSRKLGLDMSICDFIAFIDDDDSWDSNKLSKQYELIIKNNYDLILCDYMIKNKDEKLVIKSMGKFAKNFKEMILREPGPFLQTILIKKVYLINNSRLFNNQSVPSEDWNFFIELSKLDLSIGYIHECLFTWNINNDNQSLNLWREGFALKYILNKHKEYIVANSGKSEVSNHYRRIGRIFEKLLIKDQLKTPLNKAHKIESKMILDIISYNYKNAYINNPKNIKNLFYFICISIGYLRTYKVINFIRWIRNTPN